MTPLQAVTRYATRITDLPGVSESDVIRHGVAMQAQCVKEHRLRAWSPVEARLEDGVWLVWFWGL